MREKISYFYKILKDNNVHCVGLPLLILFLSFFSALALSQSISLLDPIVEESIATGNLVETELQVKNKVTIAYGLE